MTAVALLLIVGCSVTLGGFLARAFLFPTDDSLAAIALRLAAGLGATALLLALLALPGFFSWSPFVLGALALAALPALRGAVLRRSVLLSSRPFLLACSLAALAGLASLAPVTDPDSLAYPLPIAARIAAEGRWRFLPDFWFSVFPLSHELLVAFVLRLSGERLAAVSALELSLAALLLFALARRVSGRDGVAAVAVVLGLGCPVVGYLAIAAKEDLLLAVMTLAAAYLAACDRDGDRAAAAGLFGGFAAGAKGPGLAIALGGIAWQLAAGRGRRLRSAVLTAVAAALGGGIWYAANLVRFGNPAPPYLSPPLPAFLSPGALAEASRALRWGAGRGVLDLVAAPVRVLLSPELFGGFGNFPNPLAALGLAGLFVRDLRRRCAPLYVLAGACYANWLLTDQIARLLLPSALLLAVPAAELLATTVERVRAMRPLLAVALAGSAASALLVMGLHTGRYLAAPAAFLDRETWNHADVVWMNEHLDPRRHRVATAFKASWYLSIPWLNLSPVYQAEMTPEELATPDGFLAALRRQRVTHVHAARGFLPPDLVSRLVLVHENAASRLGGVHLFRDPPVIATAVYEVPPP